MALPMGELSPKATERVLLSLLFLFAFSSEIILQNLCASVFQHTADTFEGMVEPTFVEVIETAERARLFVIRAEHNARDAGIYGKPRAHRAGL